MKILWQVSFRPLNKSRINNEVQNTFINNIRKYDADITFCVTQFDDYGVKKCSGDDTNNELSCKEKACKSNKNDCNVFIIR